MNAGRGDDHHLAAGGPARHIPVLRDEVLSIAAPHEGGLYLDATFGAGGYSRALLATPGARVLALDRDPTAIADGAALVAEAHGRLFLVEARFSQLAEVAQRLDLGGFDGIVLDIGVSSMQLDDAARGFSFRGDGPLDMRMEQSGTERRRHRQYGRRGDARRHPLSFRRGARVAAHRPRDRARPRQGALRLDRRARRA